MMICMQLYTSMGAGPVSTTDIFAQFGCEISPPPEAMDAAKLCLLDWFGAVIAGSGFPPATLLRRALPASGKARLIPDGANADARTAALINGTASHTVEVDDIYRSGLYHPGVVTIPAALALAEASGADGMRLLTAIVVAYEVSNRIARAVNPAHYAHWHTTATVGHIGAAMAGAVVLGLDRPRTGHALATAVTFAAGLRQAFAADAMAKPLHAGRAAEGGVLAALAAREGVTGVEDMLDGPRGFGVAMSADVDWVGAVATLGSEWTITETTPKAHACCGHNFAALDAIRELMTEQDLDPGTVAEIEIATYRAALEICGNTSPTSPAEARFSLPWCAAAMVRRGSVTPDAVSREALYDPATQDLMARVRLGLDAQSEARFPGARSATVTIHLADGRTLRRHRPTRRGDPDDPLRSSEITEKFHTLAAPVIGVHAAAVLQRSIEKVYQLSDLSDLPLGPEHSNT